jgi:hypothetical protein
MHDYQFSDQATIYKRITKRQALILLGNGHMIAICPHKLRPGFQWSNHVYVSLDRIKAENTTIEKTLTNIEFYNCSYETGYYLSFYQLTDIQALQVSNQ